MLQKLYILVLLLQLHCCLGQLTISKDKSACSGSSAVLDCTSPVADYNNTIFLEEVFYGVRSDPSKECGYTSGDCTGESPLGKVCSVINQKCSIPASNVVNLPCFGLEKKADYLQIKYTCVPSSFANNLNTVDICDGGDLNNNYGIIQSPGYPKYSPIDKPCIRKLVAPAGKSFSVWVSEINIKKSDANGCSDYVKISDSKGIEDVCGSQAKSFVRSFCANEIYIAYKASTPQVPLLNTYKGFKLYYETFTVGAGSGCPTGPAINPTEGPVTTTTTTPLPPLGDTQATPAEQFTLCKGESRDFTAPTPYHVFYLEEFSYGVSSSDPQGTCPAYSPSHCFQPIASQCSFKNKCTINFANNIAMSSCGNQNAQYLLGRYRFLPTQSTSTATVCVDNSINADAKPRGVLTSRSYPSFQPSENCKTTLSVSDSRKAFKIYITDLYVDFANIFTGECQQSYVKVSDQKSSTAYCGAITTNRIYSFTSCSNTATIEYKSSTATSSLYVGFRAYYEVIDKQFDCPDTQTTTTTKSSVTTTPSPLPLFSPILTTDNQKCTTPFVYKQASYDNCINADNSNNYWCSVSGNADVDGKKSNCKLGLTQNVQYNICARLSKRLTCPKNYVIFVFSSDYAVTEDKTCDGKIICTASDNNYVKNTCSGRNDCSLLVSSVTLFNCQNKPADMLQLDYACIPDNVAGFKSYDVCGSDSQFESKGFITSPNFPATVASRDCQNKVVSFGSRIQFITVYAVSGEVGTSAIIGTKCQNSYMTINDGDKICGSIKPTLLYEGCSNFFKLSLSVGAETKGFRLYYEVVDDASLCSQSTTTTTPTTPTSPAITTPPPYVGQGLSSPTTIEHFCANGNTEKTLSCPNNYIIAFRNKYYGVSNLGSCYYLPLDCTAYVDGAEDNCAGSQSCRVKYSPIQLLNCQNKFSSYLRIEYDCIPVGIATQPMCDRTFTAKNGLISSPNYPQYKPGTDCSTQITVSPDKSIKLYIVNMALNADCSRDTLELSDPYIANSIKVCGAESTNLITETCQNQLNIRLKTGDVTSSSYRGVQLYYEEIPKIVFNFQCIAPTTTKTTQPFSGTTTTTTTTTATLPSYNGFASQTYSYVSCANITIECPNNYVLVFKESAYAVSASNQCGYSPNDCFSKYSFPTTLCSGNQKCNVNVKPSISLVSLCGNKYANYIYLVYQCVPKITAGNPPKEQVELCGDGAPSSIAANSALLFKSPGYPSYPTDTKQCSKNITVPAGSTIMAYAVDLNFQGSQATNCENTSNYLTVSDGAEKISYCGSVNYATFIFQTRSTWINLQYLLKNTITTARNRGFLLYLEAFNPSVTGPTPITDVPTPPPTRTTVNLNGLAGPYRHDEVCYNTQKELYCSNKYVLVIFNEFLVYTGAGCKHSGNECSQPAQVVTNACAGKTECSLFLPPTAISLCNDRVADLLDFEFQCIPTEAAGGSRVYSCDSPNIGPVKNGFLISPGYATYTPNVRNCDFKITPNANEGLKLYLIDLATNQPTESGCIDGLVVDGQESLCGSDTARELLVTTSSRPVTVSYSSLNTPLDGGRGFKIYFETYSLTDLITTTQKQTKAPRSTPKTKTSHNSALYGVSFGVGIPLLIAIVGLMYYFRRMSMPDAPQIRFSSKNNESKINEDIRSFANPNASL